MRSLEDIVARRKALVARAARQREQLAVQTAPLVAAAGAIDRAASGIRWLRAHPQVMLAGGVAAATLAAYALVSRPFRLARLVRLGFTLWRAWGWLKLARSARGPFEHF